MQYSEEFKEHLKNTTQKGSFLVKDIEFPKNKESLLDIIHTVWSAAKIEGAAEIAQFAETIQRLVQSTLSGSTPLSSTVKNILAESLTELQRASQDESQVDNNRVQAVKEILDNIKREEKDYIILKRLRVLYIDEDSFSHYKVKRNADKYIEIIPCLSAQEALSKLESAKYDIILCDFRPADHVMGEIFNLHSSKIPIVAISTSDNPKDAQTATKMGAMDFLIKNDEGMKWISRSLHTAVYDWQRRIRQNKRKMIDPQAKRILKYMLSNPGNIRLTLDSHIQIVSDSGRPVLGIEGTSQTDLGNLVALNYLSQEPSELAFACPRCHSTKLRIHLVCQNCHASDFIKGKVIEHNKCGNVDLEESYVTHSKEDKLICQKCNRELRLIGVDYFRLESAFKCRQCSVVFSSPQQEYDCTECNLSGVKLQELGWQHIDKYALVNNRIPEIKRNVITLDDIEQFLRNEGFKVNPDFKIESKQETIGPFDIVAQKGDNLAVIVSLGADVEESFSKLVQMDNVNRAMVAQRISRYAILFSDPQEVVLNLMNKFGVIPIVIEDTTKLLDKFKQVFMVSFIIQ